MDLAEFRQAVAAAKHALVSAPSDPMVLRRLADATAILAFESGFVTDFSDEFGPLLDDAISIYESALLKSPEDGVLLNNLGVAQSDRGFHAAAVTTLRQAAALIPDDRNVHFNLGVALMNTDTEGRNEARCHFKTASKLQHGIETRESYFDPQAH